MLLAGSCRTGLKHAIAVVVALCSAALTVSDGHPSLTRAALAADVDTAPVTLDAAVAAVRKQTGGRVVGTETLTQDSITYYRIKVLLRDGRVRVYTVNAQTGVVEE